MNIQGQAAVIMGGASGPGAATARELARRGAKVAILDRNGAGAVARAAEIGANAIGIECAITSASLDRLTLVNGNWKVVPD